MDKASARSPKVLAFTGAAAASAACMLGGREGFGREGRRRVEGPAGGGRREEGESLRSLVGCGVCFVGLNHDIETRASNQFFMLLRCKACRRERGRDGRTDKEKDGRTGGGKPDLRGAEGATRGSLEGALAQAEGGYGGKKRVTHSHRRDGERQLEGVHGCGWEGQGGRGFKGVKQDRVAGSADVAHPF